MGLFSTLLLSIAAYCRSTHKFVIAFYSFAAVSRLAEKVAAGECDMLSHWSPKYHKSCQKHMEMSKDLSLLENKRYFKDLENC